MWVLLMRVLVVTLCLAPWCLPQSALADQAAPPPLINKYHITPEERAACSDDAIRLCSDAYPNPDALIACMKTNRQQLSTRCQTAFDAGLKRRRM